MATEDVSQSGEEINKNPKSEKNKKQEYMKDNYIFLIGIGAILILISFLVFHPFFSGAVIGFYDGATNEPFDKIEALIRISGICILLGIISLIAGLVKYYEYTKKYL